MREIAPKIGTLGGWMARPDRLHLTRNAHATFSTVAA